MICTLKHIIVSLAKLKFTWCKYPSSSFTAWSIDHGVAALQHRHDRQGQDTDSTYEGKFVVDNCNFGPKNILAEKKW